ncbi:MAG: hypothetical protein DLM73_02860 [Chthoniobacterales bacterium]|nr:MAG: hypothetical protein DLM73_02860 [Chthoniobacterales bacterium]
MKAMNPKNLSALLVLLGLPFGAIMADDVPKAFSFARYQGMLDRSPFAVATAVAAPAATPNFAKDLYIANAAHSKDGDLVTVASNADKNFKRYLTTAAPVDGYSITSIEWSEKVGATKVTITKDGQTATLAFNEALLRQPIASAQNPPAVANFVQPQPVVPQPGNAMPQQPNVQRPMQVPMLPTPPPRVRGVIPRNPTYVPPTPVPTPEVEL